ncbi:MAG: hypothetical protein KGJ13_08115 [Patescibacteria group bacterium]|nr:hypothetical protein [Patescibacteria group bacterium]
MKLEPGAKVRMIYRCKRCEKNGMPNAIRYIEYTVGQHGNLWIPERPKHWQSDDYTCPNCGRFTDGRTIKARLVPEQKCDGRCVNAIGPNCSCSCGGANHGSGYTYHWESK